ncbi:phenylacetate--CoA ligase family protein [Candidatus Omnitrophota bacterium]
MMLSKMLYKMSKLKWSKGLRDKCATVEQIEGWSLEQIRRWQLEKIKKLLSHAVTHIPYYKGLFKQQSIDLRDIQNLEDLKSIPLLTRELLQAHASEMKDRGLEGVINHSGGTTGQPLHFYQDQEYLEWARISRRWALINLSGFTHGEKIAYLWGSDHDSVGHITLRGKMSDRAHNIFYINTFDITQDQIEKYARTLLRWKPKFIVGYASSLKMLADLFERNKLHLKVEAIRSAAGTLYPSVRKKLEDIFSAQVYNQYGSREVSLIASECDHHEGLHECVFHNYVETIDIGDGFHKIIVTNLHNKVFPFIRYDIGDTCRLSPRMCSCGRNHPLIERVTGKNVEIITSPSGKLIDGAFFNHLFYIVGGIAQFQVVQESKYEITIKLVKGANFDVQSLKIIEDEILKYGDPQFNVKFIFLKTIKPAVSGKRLFIMSKVPLGIGD